MNKSIVSNSDLIWEKIIIGEMETVLSVEEDEND